MDHPVSRTILRPYISTAKNPPIWSASHVRLDCISPFHFWSSRQSFPHRIPFSVASFDLSYILSNGAIFLSDTFFSFYTVSVSIFFLCLHSYGVPYFISSKIFRNIFLSNVKTLFSSDFLGVQVSDPYSIQYQYTVYSIQYQLYWLFEKKGRSIKTT